MEKYYYIISKHDDIRKDLSNTPIKDFMTQEQFEKMISGLVLDKDKYYKGDEA
jgi:hypothetical protein